MAEATPRILGQRDRFFDALFPIFKEDRDCILITADNGAPSLDQFVRERPQQFIQTGIAEQQAMGMAAGLAVEGKKVYVYAIAPFMTERIFEFVKIDVAAMNLPIVILGIGAGYAYDIMGPTHHCVFDVSIMRALPNIVIWSPCDGPTAASLARESYGCRAPQYIRFDRAGVPDTYSEAPNFTRGFEFVATNHDSQGISADLCILTTSAMVNNAIQVCELLRGIVQVDVVDIFRLKPVIGPELLEAISYANRVMTLEEHTLNGGLGSIIAELFVDNRIVKPLARKGIPDQFVFDYGGRENIWKKYGLTASQITTGIRTWLNK